jgi:hypothetical protein
MLETIFFIGCQDLAELLIVNKPIVNPLRLYQFGMRGNCAVVTTSPVPAVDWLLALCFGSSKALDSTNC